MAIVKRKQVSAPSESLPVLMAIGIDEALTLMSQGQICVAADLLKGTLLRASIIDQGVQDVISGENLHESKF